MSHIDLNRKDLMEVEDKLNRINNKIVSSKTIYESM